MATPNIAVFTATRNPGGLSVPFYGIQRQTLQPKHWFVADQMATKRGMYYSWMREEMPNLNIESYQAEISEGKISNLAHVSNWALKRARELEVDLLVFLQDFIWIPKDGIISFWSLSQVYPFAFYTGYVYASKGPVASYPSDMWNVFRSTVDAKVAPREPYELDTRDASAIGLSISAAIPLSNHAWEINWGAMPYSLINCGVDFDEDYDYGTQWENTQFCFDVWRKTMAQVKWDYRNRAVAMPHRDYFPKTHEGERNYDNGHRFWTKNPDLLRAS